VGMGLLYEALIFYDPWYPLAAAIGVLDKKVCLGKLFIGDFVFEATPLLGKMCGLSMTCNAHLMVFQLNNNVWAIKITMCGPDNIFSTCISRCQMSLAHVNCRQLLFHNGYICTS